MDATENLGAIQNAKARTEEALAAAENLADELPQGLAAVITLFEELKNTALAATGTAETAFGAAAGATEATQQHLDATPGDHSTVAAIITAKGACETASTGLNNVHDSVKSLPGALEEAASDFTTALTAMIIEKIEEISGQIAQAKAELDNAESNISAVKG